MGRRGRTVHRLAYQKGEPLIITMKFLLDHSGWDGRASFRFAEWSVACKLCI